MAATQNDCTASHPIQCTCGAFRGSLKVSPEINRIICYCTDCQAFAHFLDRGAEILDERGGTDVIQTLPKYLEFTQGQDKLACMRLSDKGLLRWYTTCCNTPIGNTPRQYKVSFVGLLHTCLRTSDKNLDEVFGPVRSYNSANTALGEPKPKNRGLLKALGRFVFMLTRARVNGSYRQTPFFNVPGGIPTVLPETFNKQSLDN